jgi:hypothetical protein
MTCRISRFQDGGYLSNYITIFPGILIFVIFRPRDMKEYIFMFSIALEWIVNSICDHQIPIDAVKFSNTIQLSPK